MTAQETAPSRFPENRPLSEDLGLWWVMHVKPNCEKKVALHLLHRQISYYLPLYTKRTKLGFFGRMRTTELPLFRGYLSVALEKPKHGILYETKKVVRLIQVENQDAFVTELQAIAKALETGAELLVRPGLVPGRRVRILAGPLEGTEGVVVRGRSQSHLALSVRMFNQTVLVRLDPFTDVEPL